jgi:hypothetical protein
MQDDVNNDNLVEKSSRLSLNQSSIFFKEKTWKFWEGGPGDRISNSAEFEIGKYVPYSNKKYLKENSTSREFLQSISYTVPLNGKP